LWNSRKKISGNGRRGTESRKPTRKPPAFAKLAPAEVHQHEFPAFTICISQKGIPYAKKNKKNNKNPLLSLLAGCTAPLPEVSET